MSTPAQYGQPWDYAVSCARPDARTGDARGGRGPACGERRSRHDPGSSTWHASRRSAESDQGESGSRASGGRRRSSCDRGARRSASRRSPWPATRWPTSEWRSVIASTCAGAAGRDRSRSSARRSCRSSTRVTPAKASCCRSKGSTALCAEQLAAQIDRTIELLMRFDDEDDAEAFAARAARPTGLRSTGAGCRRTYARSTTCEQVPAAVGIAVCGFGLVAVAHALVLAVRRRRRDLGVLRALGMRPGEASATVRWQALTIAVDRRARRDPGRAGRRPGAVAGDRPDRSTSCSTSTCPCRWSSPLGSPSCWPRWPWRSSPPAARPRLVPAEILRSE